MIGYMSDHEADSINNTLRICNEARARMNKLPYDSPERERLYEAGMERVYGAPDWREKHAAAMELLNPLVPKPLDGSWMDEDWACRLCGGEIPYGHRPDCDILKKDMELATAKRELAEAIERDLELDRAIDRITGMQGEPEHPSVLTRLEWYVNALRREIEVLRLYGNKDCTAMADDALRQEHSKEIPKCV